MIFDMVLPQQGSDGTRRLGSDSRPRGGCLRQIRDRRDRDKLLEVLVRHQHEGQPRGRWQSLFIYSLFGNRRSQNNEVRARWHSDGRGRCPRGTCSIEHKHVQRIPAATNRPGCQSRWHNPARRSALRENPLKGQRIQRRCPVYCNEHEMRTLSVRARIHVLAG
jgi:hypothetical protein